MGEMMMHPNFQSVFSSKHILKNNPTMLTRSFCNPTQKKKERKADWWNGLLKMSFGRKHFLWRKLHSVTRFLTCRPICSLVWCHLTTRHQPTLQWCWWLPRVLQEVHSHPYHRPPSTPFLFPPPHISPTWHIHRVRLFYWMPTFGAGGLGVRKMCITSYVRRCWQKSEVDLHFLLRWAGMDFKDSLTAAGKCLSSVLTGLWAQA